MKAKSTTKETNKQEHKLTEKEQQNLDDLMTNNRYQKRSNLSSPSKNISLKEPKRKCSQYRQGKLQSLLLTSQRVVNHQNLETPSKGKKIQESSTVAKTLKKQQHKESSEKKLQGKVYREFSRQKYNKYKAQFPNLRQSQVVTKIIKEWDYLLQKDKEELGRTYLQKKFISLDQDIESSELLIRQQMKNENARLQAQKQAKKIIKEIHPTYFHSNIRIQDQEGSQFNRHSEIEQEQKSQISQQLIIRKQVVKVHKKQTKIRRNKKTKKIKKNLKNPEISKAIKASHVFQAYWMLYHNTSCKDVPIALKRQKVNGNIAKKMRHRMKSEKNKVIQRMVRRQFRSQMRSFKQREKPIKLKVVYNKKQSRFKNQPEITQKSPYILCHKCNKFINQQRSQGCKKCNMNYHNSCAKKVRKARSCMGCSFDAEATSKSIVFPQMISFKQCTKSWLVRAPLLSEIEKVQARQYHQANRLILLQRLDCVYTFFNKYPRNIEKFIILQANPQFEELSHHDKEIVLDMASQDVFPPVLIKKHDKIEGYGVYANRNIKKHELIDSYSGDVLNSYFLKKHPKAQEYIMALFEGLSDHTTWSICPYQVSSFGPLLNCALRKKDVNVSTFMCHINYQFVILMRADREIKKGEELLYEYNGRLEEYDTSSFRKI